jgi:hypothetical protein
VRLLVDDLKLIPKDVEPPKPAQPVLSGPAAAPAGGHAAAAKTGTSTQKAPHPGGAAAGVWVSVDQIARPGAVVSGRVTFSDGNQAAWYLDQTGRLGLVPEQAGYRPPQADLQQFQSALDSELTRLGF